MLDPTFPGESPERDALHHEYNMHHHNPADTPVVGLEHGRTTFESDGKTDGTHAFNFDSPE